MNNFILRVYIKIWKKKMKKTKEFYQKKLCILTIVTDVQDFLSGSHVKNTIFQQRVRLIDRIPQ